MLYSVQVRLEEQSGISARMAEMRQWLESRGVNPDTFQHRMDATGVAFRLDFNDMGDAAAFVAAFDKVAVVMR